MGIQDCGNFVDPYTTSYVVITRKVDTQQLGVQYYIGRMGMVYSL